MDENKSKNSGLKESTAQMYERTIEELKKRGASDEEIKMVEEEKKVTMAQYDFEYDKETVKELNNEVSLKHKNDISDDVLMSNMFIVRIGDVPYSLNRYVSVYQVKKLVTLSMLETKTFSPYKYFSKNKKHKELTIEYLNNRGEVVRVDKIKGLKVKSFTPLNLFYDGETPVRIEITFKFKKYVPATDKEEWPVPETEV